MDNAPPADSMPTAVPRILAIDPGTRYMGVAVLEGTELIYYSPYEPPLNC